MVADVAGPERVGPSASPSTTRIRSLPGMASRAPTWNDGFQIRATNMCRDPRRRRSVSACTPTRRTPDLSKTRIVCPEQIRSRPRPSRCSSWPLAETANKLTVKVVRPRFYSLNQFVRDRNARSQNREHYGARHPSARAGGSTERERCCVRAQRDSDHRRLGRHDHPLTHPPIADQRTKDTKGSR